MSREAIIDPVFDPSNPGESLDMVYERLGFDRQQFNGIYAGEHTALSKGEGSDIDGVREYEVGDPWQRIDWPMTMNEGGRQLYIRERYENISPSVIIVTDMLQTRNKVENPRDNPGEFPEQLLAMSAVVALLRMAQVEELPSAVIASDDNGIVLPPRQPSTGRGHIFKHAEQLAEVINLNDKSQKPDYLLRDLLSEVGSRINNSILVVVSDFRDEEAPKDGKQPGWVEPLSDLAGRRNQIIAIETTNPWDFKLPETDDRIMVNGEILYVDQVSRDRYEKNSKLQSSAISKSLAELGVRHVTLSTVEGNWTTNLSEQLKQPKTSISSFEDNIVKITKVGTKS